MIDHRNRKKKLIISYKNLDEDLRELFKDTYPDGYKDYLQKTIKPNGEPLFVVPLETDDTSYMVKFDVKIDSGLVEDDIEKDLYNDDDEQDENEFAPISEAIEKDEGTGTHRVGKLNYGSYDDVIEKEVEGKKEFEVATADIAAEFGDSLVEDADSIDNYIDDASDEEDEDDEDVEPDDDDLLDIEALLSEADAGEGILREDNPPDEETRPRRKGYIDPDVELMKAVSDEMKAAKKSTVKTAEKAPAKTPEPKKETPKPAAKPAPKKEAPKPTPKPAPKKEAPKPAAKPAPKKETPKPAATPAPKKEAPKLASKPAPKREAPKPAAKPAPKKETPKPAATPAPKKKPRS